MIERRVSASIGAFIGEELGSYPETGHKMDTPSRSNLDLASLASPLSKKKGLGRRGTPAPFGFKVRFTVCTPMIFSDLFYKRIEESHFVRV